VIGEKQILVKQQSAEEAKIAKKKEHDIKVAAIKSLS
jgi:hypothetical protein